VISGHVLRWPFRNRDQPTVDKRTTEQPRSGYGVLAGHLGSEFSRVASCLFGFRVGRRRQVDNLD